MGVLHTQNFDALSALPTGWTWSNEAQMSVATDQYVSSGKSLKFAFGGSATYTAIYDTVDSNAGPGGDERGV